jgi:hypothetical protein
MCNQIEQIRQKLWCDAYLKLIQELPPFGVGIAADNALNEFDKRFNDKLRCKDSQITVKGVDIQKAVERYKNNQDSFE